MEKIDEEEIEDDVSKYSKLESLALSEGGVLLMKGLKSDIGDCVSKLITSYRTASHIELIATIAHLDSKFNTYKALSRSSKNKILAKEALEQLLTE